MLTIDVDSFVFYNRYFSLKWAWYQFVRHNLGHNVFRCHITLYGKILRGMGEKPDVFKILYILILVFFIHTRMIENALNQFFSMRLRKTQKILTGLLVCVLIDSVQSIREFLLVFRPVTVVEHHQDKVAQTQLLRSGMIRIRGKDHIAKFLKNGFVVFGDP